MRASALVHLVIACIAILTLASVSAEVLGIDLGSENFKVVLVKVGGMDVALNEDSGRKSPVAVSFLDGGRQVGGSALNLVNRAPNSVFTHFTRYLGYEIPHPVPDWVKSDRSLLRWMQNARADPNTNRLLVKVGDEDMFIEELTAHLLMYAASLAQMQIGAPVKDCAITVPAYWTKSQRQALLDAAKLANLNVLGLINQPAALALKYGIERKFSANESQYVVFFDMGASDLQISLFNFTGVPDARNRTVGSATLIAQEYDESLGGRDFDVALMSLLMEQLSIKHPHMTFDPKVQLKLQQAARRAKEILSANKEVHVHIDSLPGDIDFQTVITREQAEEKWFGLIHRAVLLTWDLFNKTNIPIDQIAAFELFGGGTRIPALQAKLEKLLRRPLDKHLNTDEAAVFGAALYGASLSATHRVRKFYIHNVSLPDDEQELGVTAKTNETNANNTNQATTDETTNSEKASEEQQTPQSEGEQQQPQPEPQSEPKDQDAPKEDESAQQQPPKPKLGLTPEQLAAALRRIREISERDRQRRETERAKNTLEAYIYEVREKLSDDEEFIKHITDDEREKLVAELESSSEWLEGEGESATRVEYVERHRKMLEIVSAVKYRIRREKELELEAARKAAEAAEAARKAAEAAANNATEPSSDAASNNTTATDNNATDQANSSNDEKPAASSEGSSGSEPKEKDEL